MELNKAQKQSVDNILLCFVIGAIVVLMESSNLNYFSIFLLVIFIVICLIAIS